MPQLAVETFASQIVWLLITFVVLYLIMARAVIPRVGGILEDREARIRGDLDKAEALRADTDKAIADYEERLAEARTRANEIVAEMKSELAAENDERRRQIEAEIAERTAAAETQIAEQRRAALASLDDVARAAAASVVEKLAGQAVDEARITGAVAEAKGGR